MTKTNWFLLSLIVLLLVTTFCFYRKTDYLERRIECLGDNVIYACDSICASQFERYEFREQSYIRQQEHDTNLILFVIASLIAIASISVYKVSEDRISSISKEYLTKYEEQETKYNETQKTVDRLQSELQHETYFIKMEDAKRYKQTGTVAGYVYYALSALGYLAQSHIGYYNSGNEELAESYLDSIKSDLKDIDASLTKQEVMGNITKSMIDTTVRIIMKVEDEEVKELLYNITLKLKFDS